MIHPYNSLFRIMPPINPSVIHVFKKYFPHVIQIRCEYKSKKNKFWIIHYKNKY